MARKPLSTGTYHHITLHLGFRLIGPSRMIPGLQLIQERPRQFLQIRRRSVRLCPHGKWLVPRVSSPWPKDWSLKAANFFPTQDDPVRRRVAMHENGGVRHCHSEGPRNAQRLPPWLRWQDDQMVLVAMQTFTSSMNRQLRDCVRKERHGYDGASTEYWLKWMEFAYSVHH